MKAFKFKLQAVLDYRADQVDLAQQEVAKQEKTKQQILERLREFDQIIEQAFIDQQTLLTQSTLNITQVQAFPNYLWRLKQSRAEAYQALRQQEEILRIRRDVLKQIMIKKKSLDVLKEKAQARFQKTVEQMDEAFLAEIAQNLVTRQNQLKRKQLRRPQPESKPEGQIAS